MKDRIVNFQEKRLQQEEKKGKVDKFLRLAVLANIITVPFWIAIGHPEIALIDMGGTIATEEVRKKLSNKGRNRISPNSRMAKAA